MDEKLQLSIYLINIICGVFILILIDVWLRLRGVNDSALIWIYLSLLSWVVAISAELMQLGTVLHIDQSQIKYLFSIVSSVLWVWTAFKLSRVREVFSHRNHRLLKWTLFWIVLGLSSVAWAFVINNHSQVGDTIDVVASIIAGIALGLGVAYSFYRYGNWWLVVLSSATFVIFIHRQVFFARYGRPTEGFYVWYFLANMDFLIMLFIALAVAWALSESSRLKSVGGAPGVQIIALFFDLRGSTQWAHRLAEKDFNYVRLFLDELREWATKKTSGEPQGRPKLIKFLGDGFLFVWEISEDSVATTSNAITAAAYDLCADYREWVNEKEFIDRFPWGVPVGIGYGVDVGHAIRLTFENGSDDYLGAPVNIAAKMQDLARPNGGGVVQTEVWSRLLKPHLREKFPNEGVLKIGDRSVAVRMTAEVEYKNHRSKKLRGSPKN